MLADLFKRYHIVFTLAVFVIVRLLALQLFPLYDDAFITFQYARNLALHGQFVYSLDIWVQAVTCPLFAISLSPLYLLGFEHTHQFIPLLNILFELLLFFGIRALIGDAFSGFFILMLGISPLAARVSTGGMEMAFWGISFTAILYCMDRSARHRYIPVIASAAFFIRPEMALMAIIGTLFLWYKQGWKKALIPALCGLSIAGAGMLIMQLTYGSPLPQSILAKSAHIKGSIFTVLNQLLIPEPFTGILHLIFWASLIVIVINKVQLPKWMLLNIVWYILYLSSYLWMRPAIWTWYAYPLLFAALAHIIGLFSILASTAQKKYHLHWISSGMACAALLFWCILYLVKKPETISKNLYAKLSIWAKMQNDLPFKSVLAGDAGAIGYFTGLRVIDVNQLVWKAQDEAVDILQLIQKEKPDYIFANATRQQINQLHAQQDIQEQYIPIARFSKDQNPTITWQPQEFEQIDWKQDYLMLERKSP
jgi:hypothetical protein